jgi:hypothetical protein
MLLLLEATESAAGSASDIVLTDVIAPMAWHAPSGSFVR